jgi:SAM-dependent methyltransferase
LLTSDVPYILGHSDAELRRLTMQAAIMNPITERLLREAGLRPGMRVLDIGCGTGDVSLLAAEIVGSTGSVVGIDRSAAAVAVAQARARAAGHPAIALHEAAAEDYTDPASFDVAVGRYVLMHQPDPAAMIRAAVSHVRPGGVLAFHEIAVYDAFEARPAVPLWQEVGELIGQAFRSVMLHPDIAGRLIEQFHRAGLGQPMVFCEQPVAGGHDFAAYSWAVNLLRSLVPQLEAIGVVIDGIGIGTLEDRLRDAIAAVNGQACLPRQFCCWSQV